MAQGNFTRSSGGNPKSVWTHDVAAWLQPTVVGGYKKFGCEICYFDSSTVIFYYLNLSNWIVEWIFWSLELLSSFWWPRLKLCFEFSTSYIVCVFSFRLFFIPALVVWSCRNKQLLRMFPGAWAKLTLIISCLFNKVRIHVSLASFLYCIVFLWLCAISSQ